ncbi:hypothetical protein [Nonomuraea sp. NPDC001699]
MRSFQRASAWLAAYVMGLPALGLVALILALRGRSWWYVAVPYLGLFMLAYLIGLILLALLHFRPDWLRALVAAVVVYAIASVTPLTDTMTHYPYHVVRCGGLPVIGDGFGMSYNVPGDEYYSVTPFDHRFYCKEKEAEAAGYHHFV